MYIYIYIYTTMSILPILPSVAGFRWKSDNCDNYHHLRDTKGILKKNELNWSSVKRYTLYEFKSKMVDNILKLLYPPDGSPNTEKIYLGKQQYELSKKKYEHIKLKRDSMLKDGAVVLEQEFAREFLGVPIHIETNLSSSRFKIQVRKHLHTMFPNYQRLMNHCIDLDDKYRRAEANDIFIFRTVIKSYFIPKKALPHADLIYNKSKDVCTRFVTACGLYTITLPSAIKRIVSLWFDEYTEGLDLTESMLDKFIKLIENNFCLLSGKKGKLINEHLVEYSQAGIVLEPLGTQYPFGYIDDIINGGILKKTTTNEETFDKYSDINREDFPTINEYLYDKLIRVVRRSSPEDSPLNWKTNGYVGRLLIQCLIKSDDDHKNLTRADYIRFLYALDIYYKSECGLRSNERFHGAIQGIEKVTKNKWETGPKQWFDVVTSRAAAAAAEEESEDESEDEWFLSDEEEEVQNQENRINTLKHDLGIIGGSGVLGRSRGMEGAGKSDHNNYIGNIGSNKGKYIQKRKLALSAVQWDSTNISLFGMLVDTYIIGETTIDIRDIFNITFSQYSDVMRFFFTILEIYNIDFDHASLQFDFETKLAQLIYDLSVEEKKSPYDINGYLYYIYEKVTYIYHVYDETIKTRHAAVVGMGTHEADEDAATPVDDDAAAAPMVTGDDSAIPVDDDAAAAPMVTGDDAAIPVDDDDAAAPMVTGGNAPMVTATDDGSGGDAVVSVSDGSGDNGRKRRRIGSGKKTRRKHKRNHKKSRRKRYTRNKKLKLRKRKTTRRKKEN